MKNYAHSAKRPKINYGTKEDFVMSAGAQSQLHQGYNMGGYNDHYFKKSCVNASRRGGVSSTPDVYPA